MVSVIRPTTPTSAPPLAEAESEPALRDRASARVRRTLATASARPDRPTTITFHWQVASAAAARARSRATSAVIGPILLSSPGSELHPARVRHGTQSTARPARRRLPGGPRRSCAPAGLARAGRAQPGAGIAPGRGEGGQASGYTSPPGRPAEHVARSSDPSSAAVPGSGPPSSGCLSRGTSSSPESPASPQGPSLAGDEPSGSRRPWLRGPLSPRRPLTGSPLRGPPAPGPSPSGLPPPGPPSSSPPPSGPSSSSPPSSSPPPSSPLPSGPSQPG